MQSLAVILCLALSASPATAGETTSPVAKVLEMLEGLMAKTVAQGTEATKLYDKFSEWCEDSSKDLGFDIKTGTAEVGSLTAEISELSASISACTTKGEELTGEIAHDEADLTAATKIRHAEAADFAAEEKELTELVDMLDRAITILEREMRSGASMLQLQQAGSVAKALQAMVQASAMSSADASRLTALVQDSQKANDEDEDAVFGAPSAATYESHSGGIIRTMEGLLSKAQEQLDTARQQEMTSAHNYEILRQSLADEIKYGKEDWLDTHKCVSEAQQSKAVAEGDLSVTSKDLAENDKALKALHHNCMSKATEFEENTKSRDEELKGLAQARAIIAKSTGGAGGAEEQTYGLAQVSFLQFSQNGQAQLVSGADLANFEAVRFIRDLARKQNSPELMQLASRMASAIRMGAGIGDDPFGKVKGLIEELIVRLEKAAAAEAAHKEYCDKEFAETYASKDTKEALVSKFTSKIDGAKARSAQLKDEVAGLSAQLSALHKTQMEMDAIRAEEKAAFDKNKPEMEEGLAGVKLALKVLRDYYGKEGKDHEAAEGASTDVIGLIEVIESDFSKALSQMTADEEATVADHTAQTNENEVVKAMKEQDVEYKTKEATSLDKAVAELSSDLASVHEELAAIMEYLEKLKEMCIAKPETYEERKARREREIAGLKEALDILEGEAVLIQSSARTAKSLRKVRA